MIAIGKHFRIADNLSADTAEGIRRVKAANPDQIRAGLNRGNADTGTSYDLNVRAPRPMNHAILETIDAVGAIAKRWRGGQADVQEFSPMRDAAAHTRFRRGAMDEVPNVTSPGVDEVADLRSARENDHISKVESRAVRIAGKNDLIVRRCWPHEALVYIPGRSRGGGIGGVNGEHVRCKGRFSDIHRLRMIRDPDGVVV